MAGLTRELKCSPKTCPIRFQFAGSRAFAQVEVNSLMERQTDTYILEIFSDFI
jgi:hypothetical protein